MQFSCFSCTLRALFNHPLKFELNECEGYRNTSWVYSLHISELMSYFSLMYPYRSGSMIKRTYFSGLSSEKINVEDTSYCKTSLCMQYRPIRCEMNRGKLNGSIVTCDKFYKFLEMATYIRNVEISTFMALKRIARYSLIRMYSIQMKKQRCVETVR